MSDPLRPHGLQYTRLPCPSLTPGVYSNSSPLNWWCHPAISSSVIPFSSCLQSFPASGSSQMSQFFASGGQSIRPWAFLDVTFIRILGATTCDFGLKRTCSYAKGGDIYLIVQVFSAFFLMKWNLCDVCLAPWCFPRVQVCLAHCKCSAKVDR